MNARLFRDSDAFAAKIRGAEVGLGMANGQEANGRHWPLVQKSAISAQTQHSCHEPQGSRSH